MHPIEGDNPNIKNCLDSYNEMKGVLESQIKNNYLIKRKDLSNEWTDLLIDVNFQIKFITPGLRKNVQIIGVKKEIVNITQKTSLLFTKLQ